MPIRAPNVHVSLWLYTYCQPTSNTAATTSPHHISAMAERARVIRSKNTAHHTRRHAHPYTPCTHIQTQDDDPNPPLTSHAIRHSTAHRVRVLLIREVRADAVLLCASAYYFCSYSKHAHTNTILNVNTWYTYIWDIWLQWYCDAGV